MILYRRIPMIIIMVILLLVLFFSFYILRKVWIMYKQQKLKVDFLEIPEHMIFILITKESG